MNRSILALGLLAAALAGTFVSTAALAQGWHVHRPRASVGIYVGPGWYGPGWYGPRPWGWYGYPYYYPAPVVIPAPAPAPAPVYIERGDAPAVTTALEPGYWYYCRNPAGYYPTVQECVGGAWERVPPQTPAAPPANAPAPAR